MKTAHARLLCAAALGLGALASSAAFAHGYYHSRPRVGVYIGAPIVFSPWYYGYPRPYYYPPYYYPPAVVAAPAPQTVYIEKGQEAEAPAAQGSDPWWYYCPESKAYYPYVDRCAGGWQRVKPQPPA